MVKYVINCVAGAVLLMSAGQVSAQQVNRNRSFRTVSW